MKFIYNVTVSKIPTQEGKPLYVPVAYTWRDSLATVDLIQKVATHLHGEDRQTGKQLDRLVAKVFQTDPEKDQITLVVGYSDGKPVDQDLSDLAGILNSRYNEAEVSLRQKEGLMRSRLL